MHLTTRHNLRRILTILLLSAILGIARNVIFSGGIDLSVSETPVISSDSLSLEISLQAGYQLYRQDLPFIDARSAESYQAGHIPDAVSLPATVSFQQQMMIAQSLDTSRTYVLYCNDEHCTLADEIYEFMRVSGFHNLHIMYEGYDGWLEAGYPVTGEEQENG